MIYLLDSNVCIRYLNGKAPGLRAKLPLISRRDIAVCAVVKAELYAGAMKSIEPSHTLERQQMFLN